MFVADLNLWIIPACYCTDITDLVTRDIPERLWLVHKFSIKSITFFCFHSNQF